MLCSCHNACCSQACFVQVTFVVQTNNIPASLVINSDQTGIPLIPSPQYTRAPKGSLDVSVNGYGEKHQITVTPSNTADGRSLPLQVRAYLLCAFLYVGQQVCFIL
jgi:hypothetical protein